MGGKAPELSKDLEEKLARAHREALAARAAAKPQALPSIEGRDLSLKEALTTLRGEPTSAAHIRVALEYQRLGVADAAFDQFSAALRIDPESAAAWDGRARLWRDWGLLKFALSDATRARYFAPRRPEVLNTLGTILERAGNCDGARSLYTLAVTLDPGASYAAINLHRLSCAPAEKEGRTTVRP